jgi:hypothetical protein
MPPAGFRCRCDFQTFSLMIAPPLVSITVPPQPMTNGLDAGKSVCARPFTDAIGRKIVTGRCEHRDIQ